MAGNPQIWRPGMGPPPKPGEIQDPFIVKVDPLNGRVIVECHNGVKVRCDTDGTFAIVDAYGNVVKTTLIEGIPTMQFSAPRLQFFSRTQPEFYVTGGGPEPEKPQEKPPDVAG